MCGRYALHAKPEVIALQFGLGAAPAAKARYNICPGSDVLTVGTGDSGERGVRDRRWGLIPAWAKDASLGQKLANARGESLQQKPAFREPFVSGRCLVPASGYHEWRAVGRTKQPWYLQPADAPLFAMAGIGAVWRGPRGPVRTVALITTPANELVARIHERMPLIVAPESYAAWLDPGDADPRALKALVRPYPAERMIAQPVGLRVNRLENDDPALVEPLHQGPMQADLL